MNFSYSNITDNKNEIYNLAYFLVYTTAYLVGRIFIQESAALLVLAIPLQH
jgi:hypothetical protein